jgi:peptidoglycan/LPS O-acetylase OafA/YrhL
MQARDWDRLFSSYLLLPPPDGQMPIIAAAWTLQHESLFYALFLVALLLGRRAGACLMSAWMLLVAVVGVLGIGLHGMPRLLCDAHNVEFIFGVLACESLHRRIPTPARALVWGILLAGMVGGVAGYEARLGMDQPLLVRCALGAGFAALIWLLAGHEMRQGAVTWPAWMRWLGDASYSVYLAHSMVLMVMVGALARFIQGSTVMAYGVAGAAVVGGVAVGGLVWLLVERPLLARSRGCCR